MASELSCKLCGVRTATVYCRNDDAFLCSICDTAVHNSFNVLAHHHERFLLGDEQSRVSPHRFQGALFLPDGCIASGRPHVQFNASKRSRNLTILSLVACFQVYMPHRDAFRQWDAQPGGQDVVVAQTSSSLSSALMVRHPPVCACVGGWGTSREAVGTSAAMSSATYFEQIPS